MEHHPWAFGWDALVAIGTILLAIATFAAVFIPIYVENKKKRDADLDKSKRASIIAFALIPELSHAGYFLNSCRQEFVRVLSGYDKEAMVSGLQNLQTPILNDVIKLIEIFDYECAKSVLNARFRLQNFKDLLSSDPVDESAFPYICLGSSIHTLRSIQSALQDLSVVANRDYVSPSDWAVAEDEEKVVKWVDTYVHGKRPFPPWPIGNSQ